MKKSEIFNLLIDKICEVCEVRKESYQFFKKMFVKC